MTVRRYKIGDSVTWVQGGLQHTGEVVALQDLSELQILYVKVPGIETQSILVRLESGIDGVSLMLPKPATIDEAMALAEAHLKGRETRLPINQQLNILATGLLSLASTANRESADPC